MKYIDVIGDLHLGKKMFRTEDGGVNKFEKHYHELVKRELLVDKDTPLFIAGDIFDNPDPSSYALNVLNEIRNYRETYTCLGNHDISNKNINLGINPLGNKKAAGYLDDQYYVEDEVTLIILQSYNFDKEKDAKIFNKIIRKAKEGKSKGKKVLLITHGICEIYNDYNSQDFEVPNRVLEYLDLVVIGHIHHSNDIIYKKKDGSECKIILPGTLFYDEKNYENKVGIRRINLDDLSVEVIEKDSIKTYYYNIESQEEYENIIKNCKDNIYILNFDPLSIDIDDKELAKARDKSIVIIFQNIKEVEGENRDSYYGIKTFKEWIKDNYEERNERFYGRTI